MHICCEVTGWKFWKVIIEHIIRMTVHFVEKLGVCQNFLEAQKLLKCEAYLYSFGFSLSKKWRNVERQRLREAGEPRCD